MPSHFVMSDRPPSERCCALVRCSSLYLPQPLTPSKSGLPQVPHRSTRRGHGVPKLKAAGNHLAPSLRHTAGLLPVTGTHFHLRWGASRLPSPPALTGVSLAVSSSGVTQVTLIFFYKTAWQIMEAEHHNPSPFFMLRVNTNS